MNLKTLKDIECCTRCRRDFKCLQQHDLNQAAIEHVKNINSDLEKENEAGSWDRIKISGLVATRQWIMNFFNIAEDDLE